MINTYDPIKYFSISKTRQIINSTCVLACIQSVFNDLGCSLTQEKMIEKLRGLNLCNEDGFVLIENLIEVGKQLGIEFKKIEYHFPIDIKYNNSLFIGVDFFVSKENERRQNSWHMVRFNKHINENEFIIMDPGKCFGLSIWNKEDLDRVYKEFYQIVLIK